MNTKNWPAKLLLTVGVLACASAMCGGLGAGVTAPVAGVVEEWSPGKMVEANATATAIAPALEPTRMYLVHVLPTEQAAEAQEIVETTQRRYANARTASNAWLWLRIGVGGIALGGVLVFVGSASVERVKRAVEYEPVQVLPDRALYLPRRSMSTDPRTGRQTDITTEHKALDDPMHGRLLLETKTGGKFALFNGQRHPRTQKRWDTIGRYPADLIEAVNITGGDVNGGTD